MIGGAQFGIPYGVANDENVLGKATVAGILSCAHQFGVRKIDTAATYGDSEKRCGALIREMEPEKWEITTKVLRGQLPTFSEIESSLKKLGKARVGS